MKERIKKEREKKNPKAENHEKAQNSQYKD
jgi:hypothetical protein